MYVQIAATEHQVTHRLEKWLQLQLLVHVFKQSLYSVYIYKHLGIIDVYMYQQHPIYIT